MNAKNKIPSKRISFREHLYYAIQIRFAFSKSRIITKKKLFQKYRLNPTSKNNHQQHIKKNDVKIVHTKFLIRKRLNRNLYYSFLNFRANIE